MAPAPASSDGTPHLRAGLDLDEARRLYESGLSFSELGLRLGLSKGYLSKQFAVAEIPVRPRGRTVLTPEPQIDVEALVGLRDAGATFARLGDLFGITPAYARVRYRRAKGLARGNEGGAVSSTWTDNPAGRTLAARRRDFFADFVARVVARRPDIRAAEPQEKSWLSWGWAPFGCWAIAAPRARVVRIEARIDLLDKALNKRLFDGVVADCAAWTSRIGAPVSCERLDEHRSSRICAYRPGFFLEEDATQEQALAWSVSTFVDMHDALDPLLRHRARELRERQDLRDR